MGDTKRALIKAKPCKTLFGNKCVEVTDHLTLTIGVDALDNAVMVYHNEVMIRGNVVRLCKRGASDTMDNYKSISLRDDSTDLPKTTDRCRPGLCVKLKRT